ncbi:hypothetical protein [Streptomyces flaveus]|uniref:hypothetical protein n=1 Tax=Streptomyces flaveus TaxID=66370 RepID=UPI00331C28DB
MGGSVSTGNGRPFSSSSACAFLDDEAVEAEDLLAQVDASRALGSGLAHTDAA